MRSVILGLLLLVAPIWSALANDEGTACAPEGALNFICGVIQPEDLWPLPGGRWVVTSGLAVESGLHLLDLTTKAVERWIPSPMGPASSPYQSCDSPPNLDELRAHGISLRARGDGHATLYVVNHGGRSPRQLGVTPDSREAIEVFDVDLRPAKPTLSWRGCVPLPFGLAANSVTSTADGTILLTVTLHPGMTIEDFAAGHVTGAVYRWQPGDRGFSHVWGTELAGNNGLEISPDGQSIYVVGSGGINIFANTNPAKLLHHVPVTTGMVDNIHWSGGKLIAAGLRANPDKACAGLFKALVGALGEKCFPGYFVAAIDPATLKVKLIATGPGSPHFTGVATGLPIGNTLWLGSSIADRLAYRTLPAP